MSTATDTSHSGSKRNGREGPQRSQNSSKALGEARPGIQVISLIGYPIEGILKVLPRPIGPLIGNLAAKAVGTCFYTALST